MAGEGSSQDADNMDTPKGMNYYCHCICSLLSIFLHFQFF